MVRMVVDFVLDKMMAAVNAEVVDFVQNKMTENKKLVGLVVVDSEVVVMKMEEVIAVVSVQDKMMVVVEVLVAVVENVKLDQIYVLNAKKKAICQENVQKVGFFVVFF